ncbi:tetratricopeptide repeat protein [Roseibium sediminicola]|uniref:Tetratricopeptide repeat protein n=1 Tax=Roseibium sediminicola TaxID=2933272 RepID=A0ABT0GPM2_9HYPH|nr:tetratricopeptide repeat protein [Roseibium sp. CAU 1639]MCK7611378.1 tetratricopeptide repeat protein [Roseibium sp. CAU 1639]
MTAAAREAFEKAVALENAGQVDKALVSYLKAQELSPEDTEIAYRTASALLQTGYLEEAQSQLRRIVFAEPDHLGARASLGNCQLLLGDTDNAKQNFCEVLERVPTNRNALFGLASVLLKENKPDEAAVAAKYLVDLLPDSAAVLTLFAETQARTDQKAAAIAAYRRALKSDPDHGPALLGLAETLLLRKRFDEVIELTIRASENAPADPLPLELLSDALMGKGALEDAIEAAEAALKIEPKSLSTLVRLSTLSRKTADHKAALSYALAAHDLDKTSRDALNALGAALAALKYQAQARSVLTGLATGTGLEAPIRKLVQELVKEDGAQPAAPAKTFRPTTGQETAETSDLPKESSGTTTSVDGSSPHSSEGLTVRSDQLPNVLGLRRQDRS